MPQPLSRRRITAAGYAVDVRSAGPVTGRPFVLVHGIGVSHRYFRRLARELAHTDPVHVIDLPGAGSSPRPRRILGVVELATVLRACLTELGAPDAVLVGHSMGCQVVTLAAVAEPVLTGPVALLSPTVDDRARTALAQAGRLLLDAGTEPPRTTAIVVTDYLRFGPRRFLGTLRSMLDDRIEDRIGAIPGPVLVVRGGWDVIAPRRWAEALAARARAGRVAEVPRSGHVVQDAAPALVAELCRQLAEDATAPAAEPG